MKTTLQARKKKKKQKSDLKLEDFDKDEPEDAGQGGHSLFDLSVRSTQADNMWHEWETKALTE